MAFDYTAWLPPSPQQCDLRAQQVILDREIALRDSYQAIADSKRLLNKVSEWSAAFGS